MALTILRCTFLLVAAGVAVSLISGEHSPLNSPDVPAVGVFFVVMLAAVAVIAGDMLVPRKRIDSISAVYFGLIVGMFLTFVVGLALAPLLQDSIYQSIVQMVLGTFLCYLCISTLLQTKDDFRFIIPYVEFSKEVKGVKPLVLDTSAIIDGRIADVIATGVLESQLIVPRFVLTELQSIADSGEKTRRTRGRHGLDVLNRLRNDKAIELHIHDHETSDMAGQPVDMRLVLLAKHLEGRIVTGDYNLNKVARLHNVPVINLNDLANALKPVFMPGEAFKLEIIKRGEEEGQGIGYLDDGTMVVVQGGVGHVGKTVEVHVTTVLQTSAGRMIFARLGEG